jgi:UV DNA damage endonuclease
MAMGLMLFTKNNSESRIGFCCKWLDNESQIDGVPISANAKKYNTSSTTVAWLNRQHKNVAEEKLWSLMVDNCNSLMLLVDKVSNLPVSLRMVRLSSDVLPVYTEPTWSYFWKKPDVIQYLESAFSKIGQKARDNMVRLSFHPGQFCCIVSENPAIVEKSIEELEYHANMAKWMGYGKNKLDFKINIHLSGKLGINGFDSAWNKMSPEVRNCLTLENDEYQCGIDELIVLRNKVGIVLDIHHHLIKTDEYISPDDPRIQYICESWQDIRPVIHYSQSRQEYISKFNDCLPTMQMMMTEAKKAKLRAHSDFYTNMWINKWALEHLKWADIMAECKAKNLGSTLLYKQLLAG